MNNSKTSDQRAAEADTRKKAIIDAAATLFSRNSFHEVKVDDIAEQVGLSKGTLYLYFESKENLFFSIITERISNYLELMNDQRTCKKDPMTDLQRFIVTYIEFFLNHESFFKIIHSEKTRLGMTEHIKMHDLAIQAYQQSIKHISGILTAGQSSGLFRNIDTNILSRMLLGILYTYIYEYVILSRSPSVRKDAETIIDLFINGAKA